ncbi:hypothetical protein [Variovorax sp. PAMC28562]|nr:hypothetical protein [Variovorax sp. PAMC28562]
MCVFLVGTLGEPCVMCAGAIVWSGIGPALIHDAAAAHEGLESAP